MDLLPGIRLRIDYQICQSVYSSGSDGEKLSGFVGNGTSYYEVVSYRHGKFSGRNLIGLEPFLISIENPRNVGSVEKGGGSKRDPHCRGYLDRSWKGNGRIPVKADDFAEKRCGGVLLSHGRVLIRHPLAV
jgi:hypothetical protein